MKLSLLRTDLKKAVNGVWHDYGAGVRFLVGMAGNTESVKLARRLIEQHQLAIQTESLKPEDLETINVKVQAQTIFLGWEGVDEDDGSPMKYSAARAEEILRDPQYEEVQRAIARMSNQLHMYRVRAEEAATGNS